MQLYNLFQTDIYKSKHSRVYLGTFSSFELANNKAKEFDLYSSFSEVVIIEVELNEFSEV